MEILFDSMTCWLGLERVVTDEEWQFYFRAELDDGTERFFRADAWPSLLESNRSKLGKFARLVAGQDPAWVFYPISLSGSETQAEKAAEFVDWLTSGGQVRFQERNEDDSEWVEIDFSSLKD